MAGLKKHTRNSTVQTKNQNHRYSEVEKDAMPRSLAFSDTLFKWTAEGVNIRDLFILGNVNTTSI